MKKDIENMDTTLTRLAILSCCIPAIVSCAHVNINQVAYEVLRQEDCRRNQLEQFCSRTFASEYHEYERMRQEFIRSNEQQPWRTKISKLPESRIAEADVITSKGLSAL